MHQTARVQPHRRSLAYKRTGRSLVLGASLDRVSEGEWLGFTSVAAWSYVFEVTRPCGYQTISGKVGNDNVAGWLCAILT